MTVLLPRGSGVYQIRNRNNGKVYIGSAICFKNRMKKHLCDLRSGKHHSQKLQRSWNKHGEVAFDFTVVETIADKSLLVVREQYWIDLTDAAGLSGYNANRVAGNGIGKKHTLQARANMSIAQRKRTHWPKHAEETKRVMSLAAKGRVKSEETRRKLSLAHTGRKVSDETKSKLSRIFTGFRHTEDAKRKISAGARGRVKSEAERRAISARVRGVKRGPLSDEHRAKIGASHRGRKHSAFHVANRVKSRHRNRNLRTVAGSREKVEQVIAGILDGKAA
jgi:group I intron endonuclease